MDEHGILIMMIGLSLHVLVVVKAHDPLAPSLPHHPSPSLPLSSLSPFLLSCSPCESCDDEKSLELKHKKRGKFGKGGIYKNCVKYLNGLEKIAKQKTLAIYTSFLHGTFVTMHA
jgi:hypothetical protein